MLWNPNSFEMIKIAESDQLILFKVHCRPMDVEFWRTLFYASNCDQRRALLWKQLEAINLLVDGPWLCCGDWNTVRAQSDKLGGRPVSIAETSGINDCFVGLWIG